MSPDQLNARFEALRPHLPMAASDALFAVKYAAEKDPAGSVAKARRVAEAVLKELLPPDVPDAEDLALHQLKSMKLTVKLPRHVQACLAVIQMLGNDGAHHRSTPVTSDDARRTLDALAGLVEWFLHDHRKVPRPRRSRWGLVAAVAALALVGMAVVAGGAATMFFAPGAPQPAPVTVVAAEPPPAPSPAVVVAPTLPPASVAPVAVAVPLWSRPKLSWEPLPTEDVGPAAPVRRCPGPIVDWKVRVLYEGWALAAATCNGAPADGWFDVGTVRETGAEVKLGPILRTDHTWSRRKDEADNLRNQERWVEAEEIYTTLLAEAPDAVDVYRSRGLARLRRGDPKAALDDLAVCVLLEPADERGPCHLYVGEAYRALGEPGWSQVLADAEAYDASLAGKVAALRARSTAIRIADIGARGVPLTTNALRPAEVLKIRKGREGADAQEVCRLRSGDAVEVLSQTGQATRVRAQCDGTSHEGYLPLKLDGKPVLAE